MSDDREMALEVSLSLLRVASEMLVREYEKVQKTGQFDNPQLAAAALHEVDQMVTSLAVAGLDRVRYDGSHVNELIRRGEEMRSCDEQR
jgi:hypothetical protein